MPISATIKKLRIAKQLTQEELASYLGITSKAVSQWECGRTSPDISQIPALCNLFQISADELLGIHHPKSDHKKQILLKDYFELYRKGCLKEAFALLQKGIAEFPNDYTLMLHISVCIDKICKFSDCYTAKEKSTMQNQCEAYCKRILDECTDDLTRHAAISLLCNIYAENKEIKKAEQLAANMPYIMMCQEYLFANIYEGTKKKDADQRLKSILLQSLIKRFDLNYPLDSGEYLYSSKEIASLREKKIALLELLFEDNDFGFYSAGLSDFHEESARYHASIGDAENTLIHLEKAVTLAINFIIFMQNESFTNTSLFLKGMTEKSCNVSLSIGDNQAAIILKKLKSKEYTIVSQTDKFKELTALLEPYINIQL